MTESIIDIYGIGIDVEDAARVASWGDDREQAFTEVSGSIVDQMRFLSDADKHQLMYEVLEKFYDEVAS